MIICVNNYGDTPRFNTAYGYIYNALYIYVDYYLLICCYADFFINNFDLVNFFSIYALLSQCTSVIIPGDNQFNYDESISINLGIGLIKPILKL